MTRDWRASSPDTLEEYVEWAVCWWLDGIRCPPPRRHRLAVWHVAIGNLLDHIDALTEELRVVRGDAENINKAGSKPYLRGYYVGRKADAAVNMKYIEGLKDEISRLKRPMECGHPAACLGLIGVTGGHSGSYNQVCLACQSERAAIAKAYSGIDTRVCMDCRTDYPEWGVLSTMKCPPCRIKAAVERELKSQNTATVGPPEYHGKCNCPEHRARSGE